MSEEIDRKSKIISLFADACADQQVTPNINNRIAGNNNAGGYGNIVINGDVRVHSRPEPQSEFITSSQAFEIQQLIYRIADLDVACGYSSGGVTSARKKWWYLLRTRFKKTSYKHIPKNRYEEAVDYLQYHTEKLSSELENGNTYIWRNKYYASIYARCKERNISKKRLYQMVNQYLGICINSLTKLSDNDLKHLFNIVMS